MIEDALAEPFVTRILGVEVSVVAVEMGEGGSLKAVCEHGGERQRIPLLDLPLTAISWRTMDCCLSTLGTGPVGSARRWKRNSEYCRELLSLGIHAMPGMTLPAAQIYRDACQEGKNVDAERV